MNGIAAKIPICRLLAPRANANAARKPLVVMLYRPPAVIPWKEYQRNPELISWSETVGLGLRNAKRFMLVC